MSVFLFIPILFLFLLILITQWPLQRPDPDTEDAIERDKILRTIVINSANRYNKSAGNHLIGDEAI